MNQATMEAYAEVDAILDLMDEQSIKEIPEKLRNLFKERKAKEYDKQIVAEIPLAEQNLSKETLSILAVLHYKYWCKDEKKRKELLKLYSENDKKLQKELREKHNPDDIFKNKKEEVISETANSNNQLIEHKENFFTKFINKIKSLFIKE